jgi:hypothetical protein
VFIKAAKRLQQPPLFEAGRLVRELEVCTGIILLACKLSLFADQFSGHALVRFALVDPKAGIQPIFVIEPIKEFNVIVCIHILSTDKTYHKPAFPRLKEKPQGCVARLRQVARQNN